MVSARSDKGFTLVETLISLLVMGQILAVLSMSLSTGMRIATAQDRVLREIDEHVVLRQIMAARLDDLVLMGDPDNGGLPLFEVNSERMSFVSNLPAEAAISGPTLMTFQISSSGAQAELWLIAREWSPEGAGEELGKSRLAEADEMRFSRDIPDIGLPREVSFVLEERGRKTVMGFRLPPRLPLHCIIQKDVSAHGLARCPGAVGL